MALSTQNLCLFLLIRRTYSNMNIQMNLIFDDLIVTNQMLGGSYVLYLNDLWLRRREVDQNTLLIKLSF